ncbi:blast:V-type proton ATPase subunit F [Drosophila guanche]|uniref:Blast:V-type proton ATPase subunit F n=1 Tax=Drosophila guanche TaxID=7266 RepID=A0A3B0K590_DROGU|nr:blast:V-type proton ATPase subunit F [Drosophila guanche]
MPPKGRSHGKGHLEGMDSPDMLSDDGSAFDLGKPPARPIDDPSVLTIGIMADTVGTIILRNHFHSAPSLRQEVTLGFLLAGIGFHRDNNCNYLMTDDDMPLEELETFFEQLYRMHNLGILILDFPTHKRLKSMLDKCKNMLPVIVVVPSKATLVPYQEWKGRKHIHEQDF